MSDRKLKIKTDKINMDGEFEGWWFVARLNPPLRAFGDVASGNLDRMTRGLSEIIREWNFVDENGEPNAQPNEDTIGALASDLATEVANAYVERMAKLPNG